MEWILKRIDAIKWDVDSINTDYWSGAMDMANRIKTEIRNRLGETAPPKEAEEPEDDRLGYTE
ncbi:hypothetical protein AALB39_18095 [Lachnospiraceae bacterium 54-53]